MSHTPGPWDGKRIDLWGSDRVGLGLGFLSTSNEERRAEGLANARLIAAAPELLEALQVCAAVIADLEKSAGVWSPVVNQARAAIRKATGE